jgi:nicotinamide-nucleotide adenylyltransferase
MSTHAAISNGEMRNLLPTLRQTITIFTASANNFQLIRSFPASTASDPSCKHLHILDSSFNPPTRAHLHLAHSSLSSTPHPSSTTRLLLLLATSNADKPAVPASFEDRLAMMLLLASELHPPYPVDIALTKHARFLDKSEELNRHYREVEEQTFITGYDTLVRLLDTRYYPVAYTLDPLRGFFDRNKVRCVLRDGDAWGGKESQREYVCAIARGERESEGCRREWAGKIELVEGTEESAGVSSTKVREAVWSGDREELGRYLTSSVMDWVLQRRLYTEDA